MTIIKAIVLILGIGVTGVTLYEYSTTVHRINFEIGDKYQIKLIADECGFCFLDWQIEYTMRIKEIATNKKWKFKFFMPNGPYLNFQLPRDPKNLILVAGYDANGGLRQLYSAPIGFVQT